MKKLILFFLLFTSLFVKAQYPTPIPGIGDPKGLSIVKGGLSVRGGLLYAEFVDTLTANVDPYIKFYPNIYIGTGDSVWKRNRTATQWKLISSSTFSLVQTPNTKVIVADYPLIATAISADTSELSFAGELMGNYLISVGDVTLIDTTVTIIKPTLYVLNGVLHTDTFNHVFQIGKEPNGYHRKDQIYIDVDSTFKILKGTPDTGYTFAKIVPAGAIPVLQISIDAAAVVISDPNAGIKFWTQGGNDNVMVPILGPKNNVPFTFITNNTSRAYIGTDGMFNLLPRAAGNNQYSNTFHFISTDPSGVQKNGYISLDESGNLSFSANASLIYASGNGLHVFTAPAANRFWRQGSSAEEFITSISGGFSWGNQYRQLNGTPLFQWYRASINGVSKPNVMMIDSAGNLGVKDSIITIPHCAIGYFQSTVKGFHLPEMTTLQMNNIISPVPGLLVWNTTDSTLYQYRGFSGWAKIGGGSSILGRSVVNTTALGISAAENSIDASGNTAIGYQALQYATTSTSNTAIGNQALNNGGGSLNIALGYQSMPNGFGNNNIAIGTQTLPFNNGDLNIAIGSNSMANNFSGNGNIVIGGNSDVLNGINNAVAIGFNALATQSNTIILGDTTIVNVGIGKTTPQYKLDVLGDINVTGNFRINGTIFSGGVISFNSRTGAVIPVAGDYSSLTETLTGKTIAAGSNTITGITNSNLSGSAGITNTNLANSSITIQGTSVSLGGSVNVLNGTGTPNLSGTTITYRNAVVGESFTGSTSSTLTLAHNYISGTIRLFKNGVRVTDFTQASANTITLTISRLSGDTYLIDYTY